MYIEYRRRSLLRRGANISGEMELCLKRQLNEIERCELNESERECDRN